MAPNAVSPLAGLLLLLLVQIRVASAISSSSNPSHQQPYITAFTFQSDNEEDLHDASLHPSNNFGRELDDNDDDCDQHKEDASAIASSLLYDGGCVVSASAVMCDDDSSSSNKRSFMNDNLHTSSSLLYDDDHDNQESDDDDDDDDDNDGHSSMLSNASLRRRTKVGAASNSADHLSTAWKLPSDATAVITGGSKGIGKACVEELAGTIGMEVFTCCRNQEDLEKCLADWTKLGYNVKGVTADVSSSEGRKAFLWHVERWLEGRRLDVLVNNVGTK